MANPNQRTASWGRFAICYCKYKVCKVWEVGEGRRGDFENCTCNLDENVSVGRGKRVENSTAECKLYLATKKVRGSETILRISY